jgi:hypothetical protein
LAFHSLVRLAAEIGSSGTGRGEESGEDRLNDGSEDDLSSIGHGKSHPEDKDELEDIVEGYLPVSDSTKKGFVGLTEPVDGIDQALKNV